MSIKAPRIVPVSDPNKGKNAERPELRMTQKTTNLNTGETRYGAEKANQTSVSRARNVQTREGVKTSMGNTVPNNLKPGKSAKGK